MLIAAIATATLAVACVLTLHATNATLSQYRMLRISQSALLRAEEDLLDEETAIRGYAASRDRSLLEPYLPATQRMPADLRLLQRDLGAGGRPDLLGAAAQLAQLQGEWNASVARPTLAAKDPLKTAAIQVRGKLIVDRFRATNGRIQRSLAQEIRSLFLDLNRRIRLTTYISAVLVALVTIVVVIAAVLAGRARASGVEEAQLRTLVGMIPQMVWIADSAGRVTYLNERWYAFTGQTSADALGGGWIDAIHPEDAARAMALWQSCVRTGSDYEIEYRIRSVTGEYQWFVGRGLPERSERGAVVRWLGTCTDVDSQHAQLESVQRVADAFAQAQLPDVLPSNALFNFDATYLPAEDIAQVGGDWYDAFALDEHRFFFSVGDVTGHGLDAALMMSRVRQAIVAFASVENDPATILERTNRVLRLHRESMVTALCGLFDSRSGEVQYASAGHPPSLLVRGYGSIEELSSLAPPMGILDRIRVDLVRAQLEPGDRLICYTDGIIENERDVLAGERRLRSVISALTPFEFREPASAIRERILGGRRGRDDVAVLVLTRLGMPSVVLRAQAAGGKG